MVLQKHRNSIQNGSLGLHLVDILSFKGVSEKCLFLVNFGVGQNSIKKLKILLNVSQTISTTPILAARRNARASREGGEG
jgi:hypothetical protein